MRNVFILGLVLRIIIIPLTLHGDLLTIWEVPAKSIWNHEPVGFYYPPLSYIIHGLLSPIYFLSQYVGYWILKIPYLVFDILIINTIFKLIPKRDHETALKLWWLNPIVIYSTYAMGQNDIITALILLISVLVVKKSVSKPIFLISTAISFKTIPLFLSPVIVLFFAKDWKSLIKYSIYILSVPLLLGIAFVNVYQISLFTIYFPFTAQGEVARQIALTPSLDFALRPDSVLSFFSIILGVSGFLLLTLLLLKKTVKKKYSYEEILISSSLFIFVAYPANLLHRYVTIIPILILVIIKRNFSTKIIWILSVLLIFGFLYVWPLQWGLIDHIFPQVANFKDLREFASPLINYEHIALLLQISANILLFIVAIKTLAKF